MINRYTESGLENFIGQNLENCFLQSNITVADYRVILELAYVTSLLGAEKDLTMHGGGNTSVKSQLAENPKEPQRSALCVKASGTPLDLITPDDFVALDLETVEKLRSRNALTDAAMADEFEKCKVIKTPKRPSIESLMHGFIKSKIVLHSHPTALLKIVNRVGGAELLKKCFGNALAVIPYAKMGFDLANAVYGAYAENPNRGGVVIRHHGLVTWGEDAEEVYNNTIDIVTRAEEFLLHLQKNSSTCLDMKKIIRETPMTPDYPMPSRIFVRWDSVGDALIASCGLDEKSANKTADYVSQAISIRKSIAETGGEYEPLGEEFIADMQYREYQKK